MISVIIPVLDEEAEIGPALDAIEGVIDGAERDHEVIVVDGGSRDRTRGVAAAHGARVVSCQQGRGRQMNAGAAVANGDILLFLHVDTRLPRGALGAVAQVMTERSEAPGGGFLKHYDRAGALLRACEVFLNQWRTRVMGSLVGTQAIFIRTAVFQELGGYREWPFLEDVDLSDRMRQIGPPAILGLAVVASARRYRRRGSVRQILVNGLILLLFRCGVSPGRLQRIYQGLR